MCRQNAADRGLVVHELEAGQVHIMCDLQQAVHRSTLGLTSYRRAECRLCGPGVTGSAAGRSLGVWVSSQVLSRLPFAEGLAAADSTP